MDLKKELQLLREIDASIEPEFDLLPCHERYDDKFRLIVSLDFSLDKSECLDELAPESDVNWKDATYVWLKDERCQRFLKGNFPFVEHDGKILFKYNEIQGYGTNKEGLKFII